MDFLVNVRPRKKSSHFLHVCLQQVALSKPEQSLISTAICLLSYPPYKGVLDHGRYLSPHWVQEKRFKKKFSTFFGKKR